MLKTEEGRSRLFLILATVQLAWNFLFIIPCAFSPVMWAPLFLFAGLTAFLAYKRHLIASRVIWVIITCLRWFCLVWAGFEYIAYFTGSSESALDTLALSMLIAFTLAAFWLPTMALSICKHRVRTDGKFAVLCSAFAMAMAIYVHGIEPFVRGTLYHLTEAIRFPMGVHYALCILTVALSVAVFVSAIGALPKKEQK